MTEFPADKPASFTAATVLLRHEKGTLFREDMSEIADEFDPDSELEAADEWGEDEGGWGPSG